MEYNPSIAGASPALPPPLPDGATPPIDPPPISEQRHPAPPTVPLQEAVPDSQFQPILISVEATDPVWSERGINLLAEQVRKASEEADVDGSERVGKVVAALPKWRTYRDATGLIGDASRSQLAAEFGMEPAEIKFTMADKSELDGDLWFIGDLHGDLLSLRVLMAYARTISSREGRRANFFFLGDLFDDGPYGHLVLLEFLELLFRTDGRTGFVAGNHDVGLRYDNETKKFSSSVTPCDFADWLNKQEMGNHWHQLGKAAIDFFKGAPRAVLLPCGMLVSHGGVPHKDLQGQITRAAELQRAECLQDFVWTRAHETARRKVPNRASSGCEFGVDDFQDFCQQATALLGRPIFGLVRGHDHVPI